MTSSPHKASARAHPNIAFIKYWGNTDNRLRLPANGSISMNLDSLCTETTVSWDDTLIVDTLVLNGELQTGQPLERITEHLDIIRGIASIQARAQVISDSNFPIGAGIASSAAAFAALSLAATRAAGLELSEREMSALARLGSGSASRSIPGGFVQWYNGQTHEDSYAESIASTDHWHLVDVLAIVEPGHKRVVSSQGHQSAHTSDLQAARIAGASERIALCRRAILERDFPAFARVVEHDSNLMHAVMMTSQPPLFYWAPLSLTVMESIREWRENGLRVCYTLDAGPNVHCICIGEDADQVRSLLMTLSNTIEIRQSGPGGPAMVITDPAQVKD